MSGAIGCFCGRLETNERPPCLWIAPMRQGRESGAELLRTLPLFAELPDEQLRAVAPALKLRRYEDGDVIAREGDATESLMLLLEGTVLVHRTRAGLWHLDLAELRAGHPINLAAAIDRARLPYSLKAAGPVRLLTLPLQELGVVLQRGGKVVTAIMNCLAAQCRSLSSLAGDLSLLTLEERLVRYLLKNAPVQGDANDIRNRTWRSTHSELATRLGGSREEVTRLLGKLRRKGLIELGRRSVMVLSSDGLMRMAPRARAFTDAGSMAV